MNIETLRSFCLGLPYAKEEIKWGNDLCFLIGEKMFCVTAMSEDFHFSIKTRESDFGELIGTPGIIPAPYLARNNWILIQQPQNFPDEKLFQLIRISYELIKSNLPKKYFSR